MIYINTMGLAMEAEYALLFVDFNWVVGSILYKKQIYIKL